MKRRAAVIQPPSLPEPGARVGVVCGPCEFPRDNAGVVLCHVADQFHGWAVVLMDSGVVEHCYGLNRGPGIGWHAVS